MLASTALIARPAGRHALLQPGRGRRRAAVAAPVLVLRPSRGLHHLHARRSASSRRSSPTFARRPIFGYPAMVLSLIATAFLAFGAVGPPHVRDRPARARQELLHRGEHDDRDPDRRADLLLDRDAVDRPARAASTPLLFVLGFFFILVARRPDRRDARVGVARPAGPRHVLRRRAPALRADRRRGVPAVRRASTTGSRSSPAGC